MIGKLYKRLNFFEKLVFLVGLVAIFSGVYVMNRIYTATPSISWSLVIALFLWMFLILMMFLTDSNESIKEELALSLRDHIKETKLLQNITKERLNEIRLLKKNI